LPGAISAAFLPEDFVTVDREMHKLVHFTG
jgi:hypothetical protein